MPKKAIEEVKKEKISVPVGVKIISVLYYIGAVFLVIFGLLFLFGSGFLLNVVPQLAGIGPLLIVLGIILIGFAVLSFFVGLGLWKGQNWARITAIVLSIIGIVLNLLQLLVGNFTNILGLIVNLIIGGYLLFSKKVKGAFSKNGSRA